VAEAAEAYEMKTAIKGKWSSKPPTVAGYWFVSQISRRGKRRFNLCDVRERRGIWEWSFIDGLTWNRTDEYPKYQWLGPLIPPL
jgi:hypothetical protein